VNAVTTERSIQSWLWPTFWITLALKLALAVFIPFSGDEAYFLIWGLNPDFGFYDHPPMVGWLLWLMSQLSLAEWVLRLPVVVFSSFIGYGLYRLLRDWDAEKAAWAAVLFWLSPINLLGVLITTDASLLLFSFLAVWFLIRAQESGATRWFVWAGVMFGFACLSKYFAALLGIAILTYWAFTPQARQQSRGYVLFCLAALPAIALNLYWNYGHCWANIMFNLINRHANAALAWHKPLLYGAMLLYLMTPLAVWQLLQQRARAAALLQDARFRFLAWVFVLPLLIFTLLSAAKTIGLHWVLSFFPFFFALLVWWLDVERLHRLRRFFVGYAALHAVVFAVVLALPFSAWQHTKLARGVLVMQQPQALLEELAPYRSRYVLATEGYSFAALLSYHDRQNVMVFGPGTSHARHDDIITDFRQLQGKNILVLLKKPPVFAQYGPYFHSIEFAEIKVQGVPFYLVLGSGFDYEAYREGVLRVVKEQYYAIPNFLPQGGCFFCERYFPQQRCQRKP